MRVLGMLSGTSHDGIDVAVVDFAVEGDVLQATVVHTDSTPYGLDLRERLIKSLPPNEVTLAEVCALDTLIGQAFADAAARASEGVDLICSHGQTVFHWTDGNTARGTLQIGQPAWIAERTGLPVVADVRVRDLAAGGQGAPLVSLMDSMLLADVAAKKKVAALNLGGIANITVLSQGRPQIAYDIGPGNALIDAAAVRISGGRLRYDVDGRLAAAGQVDHELLARLLDEPYYRLPPPKTTGKELFNASYAEGADIATLTALTAETVAAQVKLHGVNTLVVSGGGCDNPVLMAMLRERLPGVGIAQAAHHTAKEAIAFALIGWLTAHGLPGNLPSCTGAAGGRILGSITPGAVAWQPPRPLTHAPQKLRFGQ